MLTNFFSLMSANAGVLSRFGNNPVRIYPYGTKLNKIPAKPYALYGVFNGIPYNYLDKVPDMDLSSIQVDIYAHTSASAIECYEAIRDASEPHAYVTNFSTPDIDIEDGLYHVQMEIDFHDER